MFREHVSSLTSYGTTRGAVRCRGARRNRHSRMQQRRRLRFRDGCRSNLGSHRRAHCDPGPSDTHSCPQPYAGADCYAGSHARAGSHTRWDGCDRPLRTAGAAGDRRSVHVSPRSLPLRDGGRAHGRSRGRRNRASHQDLRRPQDPQHDPRQDEHGPRLPGFRDRGRRHWRKDVHEGPDYRRVDGRRELGISRRQSRRISSTWTPRTSAALPLPGRRLSTGWNTTSSRPRRAWKKGTSTTCSGSGCRTT